MLRDYFNKMHGITKSPPKDLSEIIWSWLGAFPGIAAVALIGYNVLDGTGALIMLLVSLLVNKIPGSRRYPEFRSRFLFF
jgi:uncharacterized membrane protein YdjX (TVP38/TMEM64 family)